MGVVVVFVHGILSSAESCWRNKNGRTWPEILASESSLKDFGISVFTYRTGLLAKGYDVTDAASTLFQELKLGGVLNSDQLVFICHSMGGIVARQMLLRNPELLFKGKTPNGKTLRFFLVASPSLGSQYANFLRALVWIFGLRQGKQLRMAQDNSFLRDVDTGFLALKNRNRDKIVGFEVVESEVFSPTSLWRRIWAFFFRRQIVGSISGGRYFEAVKMGYDDHFSIAKPENASALQHRLLVEFLQTFAIPSKVTTPMISDPFLQRVQKRLNDPPLKTIIDYLKGEPNDASEWDGDELRNLPAYFEEVWEEIQNSGKPDDDAVYEAIGIEVILCNDSAVMWEDEEPPKSSEYWADFIEFAKRMKAVQTKRSAGG